jgi:dihydrofolate reductase
MGKQLGRVFADIDMSLDGFVAGRLISKETPLGIGGERLIWYGDDVNDVGLTGTYAAEDAQVLQESAEREGAVVMGRTTFEISLDSWGENPPIHKPCFVLTHRPAPTLIKDGGTSFTFVTSLDDALVQAHNAAKGKDIGIMGGAQTIRQFMMAGLLDELHLHVVPVLLGSGIRLFEDIKVDTVAFKKIKVRDGRLVTHILLEMIKKQDGLP